MNQIKVPELGESMNEGTVGKWFKQEGETISQGEVLLEIETDKVNLEVSAESDGTLQKIEKVEGDIVVVGDVLGVIGEGSSTAETAETAEPQASKQDGQADSSERVESAELANVAETADVKGDKEPSNTSLQSASPSARKLAREKGIDLQNVQSQDPLGRISQQDVNRPTQEETVKQTPSQPRQPMTQGTVTDDRPVERQRMSRRRQTIAARLVEAQQTAAMLTTFNEVDMTAIMDLRKRRREAFQEKHQVGLGFMSFFSKAVVGALQEFPMLNSEIDGDEVIVKKFYDIGIAVAAKEGLVVPVVRNVDRLRFADIEREIAELAGKARDNTLALSDLQGGTFTITNGGVFGSLLSTPILNTPQVGILGMHTIQLRPVAIDADTMENRPMMYIALSYDHRIVDGSEAVRFLVAIKERLEDPETLLIEG